MILTKEEQITIGFVNSWNCEQSLIQFFLKDTARDTHAREQEAAKPSPATKI